MSIATGLIAKLLLAVSVIPAAGYGGYCAYDHYNPTFHNQLIQQGFFFSPISGDLGSNRAYSQKRAEIFKNLGGDWRCSKQLFEDSISPEANADESEEGSASIPSSVVASSSNDDYAGCLVADLGHVTDTNKKAGIIKWELALRSGNKGFIYVGFFSIGKIGDKNASVTADYSRQSASTVFEVEKESNEWKIKNGLHWVDFFTADGISSVNNFDNVSISVTLPNQHTWNTNGTICRLDENAQDSDSCVDPKQWTFKHYVGFWDQKGGEDGKQAIDAIKIEVTENNKKHQHDIWSKDSFDFSESNQPYTENTTGSDGQSTGQTKTTHAWQQTTKVYDADSKKWKSVEGSTADATAYLKSLYSPWANKKGTWMEADGVCYESNNRHLNPNSEEAKRLTKFCYKEERK